MVIKLSILNVVLVLDKLPFRLSHPTYTVFWLDQYRTEWKVLWSWAPFIDWLIDLFIEFCCRFRTSATIYVKIDSCLTQTSASSLKEQSADRHVAPLGHIILIPRQPVFALSLYMLRAWQRSNKNQYCSLWFDAVRTRTHDLLHSRPARQPLHHRCGLMLID